MSKPELNDFLSWPVSRVAATIAELGSPKVVVLVPDGSRRSVIIFRGQDPADPGFLPKMFSLLHDDYMRLIKSVFDHGIKTLFMPSMTHGNFQRDKRYVQTNLERGAKTILQSEQWLDFYQKNGVRVRVYGDLGYVESLGYPELVGWARDVEGRTQRNSRCNLFLGYACSGRQEWERLMDLTAKYYAENRRLPTREERIAMYYGEHVDDVDIFIRPCEIRDSDCQPPLIGGNAEMYFPVCPLTEMKPDFLRRILYDFVYNRLRTFGRKEYDRFGEEERMILKDFYGRHTGTVIGLGERRAGFWVPSISRVSRRK